MVAVEGEHRALDFRSRAGQKQLDLFEHGRFNRLETIRIRHGGQLRPDVIPRAGFGGQKVTGRFGRLKSWHVGLVRAAGVARPGG